MNKLALTLALSLAAPVAIAQCTILSPGVSLAQNGVLFDGWTASQPIGFAFPFAGSTYNGMYISDHGLVALNQNGAPAAPPANAFVWNPATASLVVGGPVIAAFWEDSNIGTGGDIWVDSTPTHCTVTWDDQATYLNQTPQYTIQMTLHIDGRIVICLDNRVCNRGSTFGALNAITGVSPGAPNLLPAASDLSASPTVVGNDTLFEEWTTTAANTCNPLFDIANSQLTFIPLNPAVLNSGWVVLFAPLDCASKTTYGAGCDGLALDSNLPVLGSPWILTTTGLSPITPIAITFFGAGSIPAGVPLPFIGINSPGCSAYISSVLGSPSAPNVLGTAMLSIGIPLDATLKGQILYAQSLGLTLAFPSLIATSNGLCGKLGY